MTAFVRKILAVHFLLLLTLSGGFANVASHQLASGPAHHFEHCDRSGDSPASGGHDCADGCPICRTSLIHIALPSDVTTSYLLEREPERVAAIDATPGIAHVGAHRAHRARAPPTMVA